MAYTRRTAPSFRACSAKLCRSTGKRDVHDSELLLFLQVNPAGGRAVELDLQDDTELVVDAAVEQFSNGQAWPNML